MPKVEIHLEISIPSQDLDVNEVVALFEEVQVQLGPALMACYLEATQDRVLDEALGPKWGDTPQDQAPWPCPSCHSRQGFKRRGSRPRVLRKTSLGPVPFELRQVTCDHCHGTFSPFPDQFGLTPYQVSTTEFQAKAVKVACQMSYARSVEQVHELGHVEVSATAVHRWAQDKGEQVTFDAKEANGHPVLLDGTKVRAGAKQRGCPLNLGLSIRRRSWVGGRPTLNVSPVCFGVDEPWSKMGQALVGSQPARLVFDGDEALTAWLEDGFPDVHKQRGVWHLVSQLYWPLWEDGLDKKQARAWMGRLGEIIYHPHGDVWRSRSELDTLIDQLRREKLSNAAGYLKSAAPYAFTYRQHPDGMFFDEETLEVRAISSTSPLERQIREINRRTDVGVRWSVPGVRNLIGLDLVRRFDPDQWRSLWNLPQPDHIDISIVKLQVRVVVKPAPNVKTS